jgi:hypothetical protein
MPADRSSLMTGAMSAVLSIGASLYGSTGEGFRIELVILVRMGAGGTPCGLRQLDKLSSPIARAPG